MKNLFDRKDDYQINKLSYFLKLRLNDKGISQTALAKELGKTHSWVSQELFGDIEKTIKRMWVNEPEKLELLAEIADFSVESMFKYMNLYFPTLSHSSQARLIPHASNLREYFDHTQAIENKTLTSTISFDTSLLPRYSSFDKLVCVFMPGGQYVLVEDSLRSMCLPPSYLFLEKIHNGTLLFDYDVVLGEWEQQGKLVPILITNNFDPVYCNSTILRPFEISLGPSAALKAQLTIDKIRHRAVVRGFLRLTPEGLGKEFFGSM